MSSLAPFSPSDFNLPYPSYREGQIDAILFAALSDRRFKLICAPTGSGKTLINHTTPYLLGTSSKPLRTLYLVHTKSLQDQAYNDLSCTGLVDIRGHGNYPCAARTSINDAAWECNAEKNGRRCDYKYLTEECKRSYDVQTNYSHWLSIARSGDPDRLGSFDLIICDEGHLIHDLVVDHMSVCIRRAQIRRLLELDIPKPTDSKDEWIRWVNWTLEVCEYIDRPSSRDERAELLKLERDLTHLEWGLRNNNIQWVFKPADNQGTDIIPVWGKHFCETYLFRNIPHVIISSGTVNRHDAYDLGIDDSKLDSIDLPSQFPVERRPFIYSPCSPELYVDYRLDQDESKVKRWIGKSDSIVKARLDRKGIFQAWSYKYARLYADRSKHADIIISHDSRSTKEAIRKFRESSPPSLLASPAVKEGYDFPFDLCRYQIFPKIPKLDKRDPVIAARLSSDPTYSDRYSARTIEQMAGRGMRDARDGCECVIYDAYWKKLREHREYFSKWFVASWKYSSMVQPLELNP